MHAPAPHAPTCQSARAGRQTLAQASRAPRGCRRAGRGKLAHAGRPAIARALAARQGCRHHWHRHFCGPGPDGLVRPCAWLPAGPRPCRLAKSPCHAAGLCPGGPLLFFMQTVWNAALAVDVCRARPKGAAGPLIGSLAAVRNCRFGGGGWRPWPGCGATLARLSMRAAGSGGSCGRLCGARTRRPGRAAWPAAAVDKAAFLNTHGPPHSPPRHGQAASKPPTGLPPPASALASTLAGRLPCPPCP